MGRGVRKLHMIQVIYASVQGLQWITDSEQSKRVKTLVCYVKARRDILKSRQALVFPQTCLNSPTTGRPVKVFRRLAENLLACTGLKQRRFWYMHMKK